MYIEWEDSVHFLKNYITEAKWTWPFMSIIAWNYNKICIPEKNEVNLKKTF